MFNFLYSEVWWMNVIISAAITGIVSLIGSYLLYLSKINKILSGTDNLEKGHTSLFGEHKDRSKEHRALSDEHKQLLSDARKIIDTAERTGKIVADISKTTEKDSSRWHGRYEALSVKQKNITENVTDSLHAFLALKNELLSVNEENQKLKKSINECMAENKIVVDRCNRLTAQLAKYQKQVTEDEENEDDWELEL